LQENDLALVESFRNWPTTTISESWFIM